MKHSFGSFYPTKIEDLQIEILFTNNLVVYLKIGTVDLEMVPSKLLKVKVGIAYYD